MSIERTILKLAILCLFSVILTDITCAGENGRFSSGPGLTSPDCYSSSQCSPIRKAPSAPEPYRNPSGAYRGDGSDRLVPLTYVEPGPIRAIAFYAVGLLKSTIAAPFKLIETVIPVGGKTDCRPVGPVNHAPVKCQPQQCLPVCNPVIAGCAPPAPCLGPRPRSAGSNSCGPNLPAQVVKEYEFPPVEPGSLWSGLWNLPSTLWRQGRLTGDVMTNSPNQAVNQSR